MIGHMGNGVYGQKGTWAMRHISTFLTLHILLNIDIDVFYLNIL